MANREAAVKMGFRSFRLGLPGLVLCMFGLPTRAMAANNCAWINEATVSGLLGGQAVGEVTTSEAAKQTVCTFTEQGVDVKRTLRVTVELSKDPHARLGEIARICGADVAKLTAIGNEALVCATNDQKAGLGERVVGRVRDQVFTITIVSSLQDDRTLSRSELKYRIYTAAEQVAGNLF